MPNHTQQPTRRQFLHSSSGALAAPAILTAAGTLRAAAAGRCGGGGRRLVPRAELLGQEPLLAAAQGHPRREGADEDAAATGDFDVTDDLEIVGPGATMSGIDGNGWDRIFHVLGSEVDFTLRGIQLSAGASDSARAIAAVIGGSGCVRASSTTKSLPSPCIL